MHATAVRSFAKVALARRPRLSAGLATNFLCRYTMNACCTVGLVACLLIAFAGIARAQYASPFINETQPVSGVLNGPRFNLSVTGTGFVAGASKVNWTVGTTTTSLATTYVSPTKLTAVVPASLLTTVGTSTITVLNPNTPPDSGISNAVYFPVSVQAQPNFLETDTPTNEGAFAIVTADFNGDGILDVATLDGFNGDVSFKYGKGDGSFQQAAELAVASNSTQMLTADFNGDGNADLVVTQFQNLGNASTTVEVFLSSPLGEFIPRLLTVPCNYGVSPAVGDFNNDGKVDLAVACDGGTYVLLGNGDGTFTSPAPIVVDNPSETLSLTVGDFNGDGNLDMVLLEQPTNAECGFAVTMLWGNGSGGFALGAQTAISAATCQAQPVPTLATGDFNNDGQLDFAVTEPGAFVLNTSGPMLTVFLNTGDKTFSQATIQGTGTPYAIQAGDFDGDGKVDLALSNVIENGLNFDPNSPYVEIFYGVGDGTFVAGPPVSTASLGVLAAADFNGDGRLDLITGFSNDTLCCQNAYTVLIQQPQYRVVPLPPYQFAEMAPFHLETHSFVLKHLSPEVLHIRRVEITGAGPGKFDFLPINFCPASLASGASCKVDVLFFSWPGVSDPSATLSVFYDGPGSPLKVPISGLIAPPGH